MLDIKQKRSFYITVIPSCQLHEIVLFFGAKYVCYRSIMCYSHYIEWFISDRIAIRIRC